MYRSLFDEFGISYETDQNGRIESGSPLKEREGGRSLQLYFNRATKNRPEYFAGMGQYHGYAWKQFWVQADDISKRDTDNLAIRPKAGQERQALEDILRYARRV